MSFLRRFISTIKLTRSKKSLQITKNNASMQEQAMKGLVNQLESLSSVILQLCSISGIPGVSLGVAHNGHVIHQANYGYRDVEAKIAPDEDTMYTLGSLTKPITAAMIGILVEEEKLTWDTKLREIFPEYIRDERDPLINLTMTDLLSHRSGLPGHDSLWFLSDNRVIMKREDALPMFNYMPSVLPFRAGYCYNNFAYEIAGQIIEKLSGISFSTFLHDRLVKPLGLSRTFAGAQEGDNNSAKAYMSLQDNSPVEIPLPFADGMSLMGAAGGLRSSVGDLLKLYQAYMEAGNAELEFDAAQISANNPLRQIGHIWQGRINFPFPSLREYTYACGWCRTQLPGPLALPSDETDRSQLPLVGKGSTPRLTLYHEGAISGSITFSAVFPETMTSVVVLTNSVPLNADGPRFIAELIIETIFGAHSPDVDSFLRRSKESVSRSLSCVEEIQKELDKSRTHPEATRSLDAYVGRYFNQPKTFFIDIVKTSDERLYLQFYGLQEEVYPLHPYQEDSFDWLTTHNEIVSRGRFVDYGTEYYIMKFELEEKGENPKVLGLSWKFDSDVAGEPEILKKVEEADHIDLAAAPQQKKWGAIPEYDDFGRPVFGDIPGDVRGQL